MAMATLVQCEGCEKEISKKAASCPSCSHPNKSKHLSARSVLGTLVGLVVSIWWLAPSGGGRVVMDNAANQVAKDAVKQYEMAKRSGDQMQACVHAGFVSAAYMQAKDEANYRDWLAVEKRDCEAAGLPKG
jgi:hypothetical protein